MKLVQTLIDRLSDTPLPEELYFRISFTSYKIVQVDEEGVHYLNETDTGRSLLEPGVFDDLYITGFDTEVKKKLVCTPKVFIDCKFN